MTRVSLREAYDNKDVVAQIYAIRDTAESAEDSAEQAVTTANTASDHVDALVPQVEGAVANANSASASAQASAQTVAGYENRLGAVESGLNAVTLRVTTAEGQIVTIEGRVTALETADGQNVKINDVNQYAVGLTDNQANITGIKGFTSILASVASGRIAGPSECVDLVKLPLYANSQYNISGIFATRHDIGIAKVTVLTDTNNMVSSVSVAVVNSASSRNYRIGARVENDKLVLSITGILNNMNVTGLILTSSYSTGVILTPDYTSLPMVQTISNLSGYVQEA